MPVVQIVSLPFAAPFDVPAAITAISTDLAEASGVDVKHVTVTWQFLPANHYAVGAETHTYQPLHSHPLLVDLLLPDFNSPEQIEVMLQALARGIAANCGVPQNNVFINCRTALSGAVFDAGETVRWD